MRLFCVFYRIQFLLLAWQFMSCQTTSAQERMNEYQESVWNFYSQLLLNDTNNVICTPFTPHQISDRNKLTFGYPADSIKKVISMAKSLDEGNEMCILLQLDFPNKKSLFMEVSKDSDHDINYIYLSNGSNMEAPNIFLKRPAMVKEDIQIHLLPDESSESVRIIKNDEIFFFTPNSDSDWVLIFKSLDDEEPIGYLRKTELIYFDQFPKDKKKEVAKQLSLSC